MTAFFVPFLALIKAQKDKHFILFGIKFNHN